MVAIRQAQGDLGDVGTDVERGLRHGIQRVLNRTAVVRRERLDQRLTDTIPGREVGDAHAGSATKR